MTRLTIAEARNLAERTMQAIGHTADEARIIADHLIDCELRGLSYGGLPRALSIVERITKSKRQRTPITVESRMPVSALVHGGDNVGYLVALRAMEEAITRAKLTAPASEACESVTPESMTPTDAVRSRLA